MYAVGATVELDSELSMVTVLYTTQQLDGSGMLALLGLVPSGEAPPDAGEEGAEPDEPGIGEAARGPEEPGLGAPADMPGAELVGVDGELLADADPTPELALLLEPLDVG